MEFYDFPYIGNNHHNWLIFFRGVQTTNHYYYCYYYYCYYIITFYHYHYHFYHYHHYYYHYYQYYYHYHLLLLSSSSLLLYIYIHTYTHIYITIFIGVISQLMKVTIVLSISSSPPSVRMGFAAQGSDGHKKLSNLLLSFTGNRLCRAFLYGK